ncbi:aldo/keto reductase [Streptomyces sp. NRRL S-1022]|uniref:aldo/keto reductase n=1 Tax=Streptomyces sp. NRRL S-1022 TaxID=1463880 RepID=UPI001F3D3199|nr:aldo/keto reductase [Streptomyces sp. NRRL S-1022]
MRGSRDRLPAVSSAGRRKARRARWTRRSGGRTPRSATPGQVALAWLSALSPVTLPIPDTTSAPHLEENVAAASLRLDDEEVQAIGGRDLVTSYPCRSDAEENW